MITPPAKSHHCWLRMMRVAPAAAASAKKTRATIRTVRGLARPEPTRRTGPIRFLSTPRTPSE
jgi:hypothetical protein